MYAYTRKLDAPSLEPLRIRAYSLPSRLPCHEDAATMPVERGLRIPVKTFLALRCLRTSYLVHCRLKLKWRFAVLLNEPRPSTYSICVHLTHQAWSRD